MNLWRPSGFTFLFYSATLLGAFAQEPIDETTYEAMEFHKFGGLEASLDGPLIQLHRLYEGVHLTLIAETADDNLDIEAQTVEFTYSDDGDRMPSVIVFEGEVRFTHVSGTVRADKATIDLETKVVLFTGNPKADMSQIRGLEAEYIQMNLDTGDIVLGPGKVREIDLRGEDEVSDTANASESG